MPTRDSSAPSLATALHAMRPAFPAELFDGVHWERLLARAADVPAAAIEDVVGFEIRLGAPEPASDFCIVVPADGEVRAHYIGRSPAAEATVGDPVCATRPGAARLDARADAGRQRPARDSLAACLREISSAGSFANTAIAAGGTMLEYDVPASRPGSRPSPAVFWSLAEPLQPSQVGELARLLAMASGRQVRDAPRDAGVAGALPEAVWAAALRGVLDAVTPYGRISQAGTFVGRKQAGIRIVVGGLDPAATAALLGAVGWPGPVSEALDAVAAFALPGMRLAVALDVSGSGVGRRLGLELAMPGGWAGSRWRHWRPFLDRLVANGLCRADKALGLRRWCGLTRLFGRQMHLLAKGINHVKIGIREDEVEAKAYLGACRRRAADVGLKHPAAGASHEAS